MAAVVLGILIYMSIGLLLSAVGTLWYGFDFKYFLDDLKVDVFLWPVTLVLWLTWRG